MRIRIVDSGSGPDARARVARACPQATILAAGANVGYGPGVNLGLREWLAKGSGEWVVVAAHDALPAPDCLARLLAEGEARPDAAFVCAEFGAGFDMVPAVDAVLGGYSEPTRRGAGWVDVGYPHGTFWLARRRALQAIGLFDERYFAYCEEADLGLRARALGWRVGMVWGAVVVNARLPSELLADYLQVRNTLLLVRTRFGRGPALTRTVLSLTSALRRAGRDPRRAPAPLQLEARAVIDFWRGRFGPPPPAVLALVAEHPPRLPGRMTSTVGP